MKRRDFVAILGAAAMQPLASGAQDGVRRIGVLMAYAASDAEARARVDVFIAALAKLGWVEGRNVAFDFRWSGGDTRRIASDAAELVASRPSLILAATTPVVRALLKETRSIPIVFLSVSDPVGDGFVQSLAQPGGNATGFINIEAAMAGKWVELAKELVPDLARVCMIFNPKTAARAGAYFMPPFKAAAEAVRMEPVSLLVDEPGDFDRAVPRVGKGGALVVMPDSFNVVHRARIIALASEHRVPTVYPYRYMAVEGGLLSYGVDLADMYGRAAGQVDRILRGRSPGDLPIQAPTKFELVINGRVAKQFGIELSPRLRVQADAILD